MQDLFIMLYASSVTILHGDNPKIMATSVFLMLSSLNMQ